MNDTTWRAVVGVLAVALTLVGGILIYVLLDQDGPTPTASPSAAASIFPSPSASPSPSPTASPTFGPTPTASPIAPPTTGVVTPPPTPTQPPPPTASPTAAPPLATPTAPQRVFRLLELGLDGEDAEGAVERLLTFQVDGPSQIQVGISNVSAGRIRTCLWLGDATNVAEQECQNLRTGDSLQRLVGDAGQTTWTVSLIGRGSQISPSADVGLTFNALEPTIAFDNVRFQGTASPNYNGMVAEFGVAAPGEVRIFADIDDGEGGAYPYHLVVTRLGPDGGVVHESGGLPATTVDAAQSVSAGQEYRLELTNEEEAPEQEVFLRGNLSWP
jgi:hypothetical protein